MLNKPKIYNWIGAIWLIPIFLPVSLPNLFSILTVVILPFAFHKGFLRNKLQKRSNFVLLWLIMFLVYIFFSGLLLSEINELFTKYLILHLEGILVFFISISLFSYSDLRFLTKIILIYTFLGVIIGLIQFQLGLGKEYLYYSIGEYEYYRRPIPAGLDPNYYFLNLIFPLVFSLHLFLKQKVGIRKLLYLVLVISYVLGTFFTGSKAALIVLTLILLYVMIRKRRYLIIGTISLALLIFILLPLLIKYLPYSFARYEQLLTGDLNDVTTHRNIMWGISFENFLNNPFFGVGIGQMVKYYSSDQFFIQIGGQSTHNTLIHLLAETGLFGFILWFTPFFVLVRRTFNKNKQIFTVLLATIIMLLSIDASYSKTVFIYLGIAFLISNHEENSINSTI